MPDSAFSAVFHFVRRSAFWDSLVAKVSLIGILAFGEFLDDALFLFGGLFDSLVEFVACIVFVVRSFARSEDSFVVFLMF